MRTSNLKRAALAMFLATASSLPAPAQDENPIELEIQADVPTAPPGAAPPSTATPAVPALPPAAVPSGVLKWNIQVPSPFWIGVEGQPLDDAMRTALELPEKHGILVARVTAESPAANAGLQAGDILLQWGDAEKKFQPIESVEHLVKLVQTAATKQPEQSITLEYRRRGKTNTVELKPAKRAEVAQNFIYKSDNIGPNEHARHQQSALQQQLRQLEQQRDEAKKKLEDARKSAQDLQAKTPSSNKVNREVLANATKAEVQYNLLQAQVQRAEAQLRQFEVWTKAMSEHGFPIVGGNTANFDVLIPAPGFVTKGTTAMQAQAQLKPVEWPEDLRVTMTRQGNKPAEFVVQRGEEKWEVTAESLKDLPPDIRALLEPLAEPQRSRMMRLWSSQGNDMPGRVELRVPEGERPPVPGLPIAPPRVVIHATPQMATPQGSPATQKQVEDLQRALEQLRKQVELMERK
jgi:hypothetical protein